VIDQAEKTAPEAEKSAKANGKTPAVPRVSSRLIENVGVELHAYLGSARMTVAELTALTRDAVVALDAQLNAQVVLQLGDVAVAHGELVAVGDKFGVRLTEIVQWPD
jgi:flagellar motor switch protein FliN/FliY